VAREDSRQAGADAVAAVCGGQIKSEDLDLEVHSADQKLQPAIATAKAVRPLYSIEKISESLGLNSD
jgi:methylmalonyl-CoA mutase cobalamin-binding subunit